ncbi:hypothetical protein [Nocardia sp. NPDC052566]|uniref:hypothetical protein n=1 Tax=Nocardia sp. NPDC052566 TaxID=3364330 RepID=UPI0037CA29CC
MRFGVGLLAASFLAVACEPGAGENEWNDWTVTVYYTAVQSFYRGPGEIVRGCADFDCTDANAEIGVLPDDFVDAVRDEGTGRITEGEYTGRYLNWSYDIGFWLDSEPRDAAGEVLQPYRSAAADGLGRGTRLRLADCGIVDIQNPEACDRFKAAEWTIGDEFLPGLGGPHHIDLYIGEETADLFVDGQDFVIFAGAALEPIE